MSKKRLFLIIAVPLIGILVSIGMSVLALCIKPDVDLSSSEMLLGGSIISALWMSSLLYDAISFVRRFSNSVPSEEVSDAECQRSASCRNCLGYCFRF